MDGALTYGPKGRLISALAMISVFVGALQSSGVLAILPQRYYWVGLVVAFIGILITGSSERIQGGASNPRVRIAAQQSDNRNAIEKAENEDDKEIEFDNINR